MIKSVHHPGTPRSDLIVLLRDSLLSKSRLTTRSPSQDPPVSHSFLVLVSYGGRKFLTDARAEISTFPASSADRGSPSLFHLRAFNGTTIPVYARRPLTANLGLRFSFCWMLLAAAFSHPINGAGFLPHSPVLVELPNKRLFFSKPGLTVQGRSPNFSSFSFIMSWRLLTPHRPPLEEYPSLNAALDWRKPVTNMIEPHILTHFCRITD